jgi:hypothetical protein
VQALLERLLLQVLLQESRQLCIFLLLGGTLRANLHPHRVLLLLLAQELPLLVLLQLVQELPLLVPLVQELPLLALLQLVQEQVLQVLLVQELPLLVPQVLQVLY